MEKKLIGRSNQLQSKTQVSDCKKSVDTLVNKPWPRQGKKREGVNVPNKNDVRKTGQQKCRPFDKRPKPRGAFYSEGAVGGKEDTGLVECEEAEYGSVFVQGSKKQNLNHLLNFRVAPRSNGQWAPRNVKTQKQSHHHALVHSNVHRHNKELFLQSNCQFVVRANRDYSVHLVDPDIPVNWDVIEMIVLHTPDGVLTCPICLCESQSARVTRCGHAYCWACVLHYLALADPPGPRPCPVCSQPIDRQHLKSVQSMPQHFTNVGEVMQMRLMRRERDCTAVEPAPERKHQTRDKTNALEKSGLLALTDLTPNTQYAKLLSANKTEVLNIIQRERKELHFQMANEIDTTEVVYIEQALTLLESREKITIESIEDPAPLPQIAAEVINIVTEKKSDVKHDNSIDWFDVTGMDDIPLDDSSNSSTDNVAAEQNSEQQVYEELENMNFEEDNSKYYYFYQAADGQAIFLSGINQRMLYCSWGDDNHTGPTALARAPITISGKLLHRLSGSVSVETRQKLRWLSHLPLHCPFDIVELELSTPAVTQEALETFSDELEERAWKRNRAERAERRRVQRIGRQQKKQLGFSVDHHGPLPAPPSLEVCEAWVPLTPLAPQTLSRSHHEQIPGPSPPQYNGPSFAKMASTSGIWTMRPQSQPQAHTSPSQRTTTAILSDEDSDSQPIPSTYTMNLSDAITAALKNTNITEPGAKKKKKPKQKLLFSSGI